MAARWRSQLPGGLKVEGVQALFRAWGQVHGAHIVRRLFATSMLHCSNRGLAWFAFADRGVTDIQPGRLRGHCATVSHSCTHWVVFRCTRVPDLFTGLLGSLDGAPVARVSKTPVVILADQAAPWVGQATIPPPTAGASPAHTVARGGFHLS